MATRKPKCRCHGRSGKRKVLYKTAQRAVTVAIKRGWVPKVYPCPTGRGWHITHNT